MQSAVFPGNQGGPLEHVIAAKAIAFGEALTDEFLAYQIQVKENAAAMAKAFVAKGYDSHFRRYGQPHDVDRPAKQKHFW